MSILFYCNFQNQDKWLKSFRKKFTGHKIYTVTSDLDYKKIKYAIIWKLPDEILSKLVNLKAIFLLGAGVDSIIHSVNVKKIPILRLKDPFMGERMSYHVHSQILNYQLRLKNYQNAQLKRIWHDELEPMMNFDLNIGILGSGYLGICVGKYLKKLNYNVLGYKKTSDKTTNSFPILFGKKINQFILQSDIIVSILPSTEETFNFINKDFLKLMKQNSLLINVGRGSTVDEKSLTKHLKSNKNFYASLDVFVNEPLKNNNPLWKMPNVTVTPHIASLTGLDTALEQIFKRFDKYIRTGKIKSDVDFKKKY